MAMESVSEAEAEAAFTSKRSISSFQGAEILKFEGGGRQIILKGMLDDSDGHPHLCILQFDLKSSINNPEEIIALLSPPALNQNEDISSNVCFNLTNYSGAEYSYYTCLLNDCNYNVEVIWPASIQQLKRKTPSEWYLFDESADCYQRVGSLYATQQQVCLGWVDQICSLQKERERILYASPKFVVVIDTKWTSHDNVPPLSQGTEEGCVNRSSWFQAPWTNELYLLAISCNSKLTSLRDLNGTEGISVCTEMQTQLEKTAWEVYGVHRSKLRIFFHYIPQFYRLHAHCTRIEYVNPGCEVDRAHLLKTVAANLVLKPDYYSTYINLLYKLRIGEGLYQKLVEEKDIEN